MRISIFGAGYVGLVTGACMANMGHDVIVMDIDESKINILKSGKVHFFEPGLLELTQKCVQRNKLHYTIDSKAAVEHGDILLNCVDTPAQEDGSASLSSVFAVAKTIGEHINNYKVVVTRSTVPPGTAREVARIIKETSPPGSEFAVVSNPEFLREGLALRAFNYPDKIVVGADSDKAFQAVKKMYSGRMRTYLPIVETDWETAELIKYANNTFLSTKISFINEIANICDKVGADVKMVSLALGLDFRISPRFLNPGVGYGGSCFPKDVRALTSTAKKHNYHAKLFEEVTALNERQKEIMVEKINSVFNDSLSGKILTILGLSFKPLTSDMREASSIRIINGLLGKGAMIRAFDPQAVDEARKIFNNNENITFCSSPEEAAENSHALIIVTEWDEFRNLNLGEIRNKMAGNKLFDGRNIYEPELVKEEGFEYYGIGRGSVSEL